MVSKNIVVTDEVDEAAAQVIEDGLNRFNEQHKGPVSTKTLLAKYTDENGAVRGGSYGFMHWDWLVITMLWVEEGRRGQGIGSNLLRSLEREARERGCTRSRVSTMTFQAPDFYRKFGYEEECRLIDYPTGSDMIHLKKALDDLE